jgi:uncharacterized membrane protein
MGNRAWGWLIRRLNRYRGRMASIRVAPVPRPSGLDQYQGLWVATIGDEIVAAAETSHRLALDLHAMDHRRREQVVTEYVRPNGDAYIVGVG